MVHYEMIPAGRIDRHQIVRTHGNGAFRPEQYIINRPGD